MPSRLAAVYYPLIVMGCGGSKSTDAVETKPVVPGSDGQDDEEVPQGRGSVYYQSRELQSNRGSASSVRKSAVFDTQNIGTCTRLYFS